MALRAEAGGLQHDWPQVRPKRAILAALTETFQTPLSRWDEVIMEPPGGAVVNSEIVVLNATGKPSFNRRRGIITVEAPMKSQPPEDKPQYCSDKTPAHNMWYIPEA
jgi:hypothetical protein